MVLGLEVWIKGSEPKLDPREDIDLQMLSSDIGFDFLTRMQGDSADT